MSHAHHLNSWSSSRAGGRSLAAVLNSEAAAAFAARDGPARTALAKVPVKELEALFAALAHIPGVAEDMGARIKSDMQVMSMTLSRYAVIPSVNLGQMLELMPGSESFDEHDVDRYGYSIEDSRDMIEHLHRLMFTS